MEAAFCIETLEDALARHGKPDIFNTDQGSQLTGAVQCREVHAASKGDGEMVKVPTYAAPLGISIPCRFGWAGVLVTERNAVVYVVADRLHERPSLRKLPKKGPSRIRQAVGLAIPAAKQVDQNL